MSWLGILIAIIAAWLAIKVLGFVLKLALWGVVALGLYWLWHSRRQPTLQPSTA